MSDWIESYKAALVGVILFAVVVIDRVISWMTGREK